jgi:lysozyme
MSDTLQMTEAGFALLREHEGCILFAYDDANDQAVHPGDPVHGTLTIGYGHTGADVTPGLTWTQDQAEAALQQDVAARVRHMAPLITAPLTANQFSAFVCLAFNIGVPAFTTSTALRVANERNLDAVPAAILLWDKTTIDGVLQTSPGLQVRRQAEVDLWNTP